MSADPNRTEPYNKLFDICDVRGFKVGIRTGALLTARHNDQWRELVALVVEIGSKVILVERIHGDDLQAAAAMLLASLPPAKV